MVYFYRLIFLVSLLFSGHAFAYSTTSAFQYTLTGTWVSSITAAAMQVVGIKPPGCTGYSIYQMTFVAEVPPTSYKYHNGYCGSGADLGEATGTVSRRTVQVCSFGGDPVAGSCTCPGGYQENADHSSCVQIPLTCNPGFHDVNHVCVWNPDQMCSDLAAIQGSTLGAGLFQETEAKGNLDTSQPVCMPYPAPVPGSPGGCQFEWTGGLNVKYKRGNDWVTTGTVKMKTGSGLDCTPTSQNSPEMAKPECETGKVPGVANGQTICYVPSGDAPMQAENNKEKTETNADGSTTKTETKTKADCDGVNCTTTTTTTTTNTPAGGGTPTTTVTGKTETCAIGSRGCTAQGQAGVGAGAGAAPGAAGGAGGAGGDGGSGGGAGGEGGGGGTGERSEFQGNCDNGFSCSGDAIQCAMAREQHRQNCKLYEPDNDSSSLFNKARNGTDGFDMDKLKTDAQVVNVSLLDTTGRGWSSACPADPEIPLNFGTSSRSFSIPFSRICGPLGILSLAGVGITLLGSMLWILGGKKT
jgi:hypothetical protein